MKQPSVNWQHYKLLPPPPAHGGQHLLYVVLMHMESILNHEIRLLCIKKLYDFALFSSICMFVIWVFFAYIIKHTYHI